MESTKEMLLPRPALIDGTQQSLETVTVDQDPDSKLDSNVHDDHDTEASKTAAHTNIYASDPNLTMAPDNSARARLRRILSTHRFQVNNK